MPAAKSLASKPKGKLITKIKSSSLIAKKLEVESDQSSTVSEDMDQQIKLPSNFEREVQNQIKNNIKKSTLTYQSSLKKSKN